MISQNKIIRHTAAYGLNLQIRAATRNDLTVLQRIARNVIQHNYASFLKADGIADFIESGMSDQEIETGISNCLLLEEEQAIIAFAIAQGDLLHLLMVDVPLQRSGYGSILLSHVEARMFERHTRIRLQSFEQNSQAARFYAKHCWRVVESADLSEMGVTMTQYEKSCKNISCRE